MNASESMRGTRRLVRSQSAKFKYTPSGDFSRWRNLGCIIHDEKRLDTELFKRDCTVAIANELPYGVNADSWFVTTEL